MVSDNDLKVITDSLEFWETIGYVSATFVVIGCAGEAVHEFWPSLRAKSGWWDRKGGRISALLLIAALAVEIPAQFTSNSDSGRIISIINQREADARLATARLERITGWRHLDSMQKDAIFESLLGKKIRFGMRTLSNDVEAQSFCRELALALSAPETNSGLGCLPLYSRAFGVRIFGTDVQGYTALKNALKNADLLEESDVALGSDVPSGLIIVVGSKVPTDF